MENDLSTHPEEHAPVAFHSADLVNALSDHFQDQTNFLSDKSDEFRYHAENYIQTHPWRSVAVAGTVGFVLGVILGRLRR